MKRPPKNEVPLPQDEEKDEASLPLHFVISAHVVRQLGEQLVSDEVTALIELVKNAYDADAKRVTVIVNTESSYQDELLGPYDYPGEPGFISITDDGTGMDYNDVRKGWLSISFSRKRNQLHTTTPRYHRTFLGSKGVGRLSSQRLGDRLDLFSVKSFKDESDTWVTVPVGVHVGVDWNDFGENVELQNVRIRSDLWQHKRAGTTLVVTELRNREAWQDKVSRGVLVNTLAQLISPFEPAATFRLYLQINEQTIDLFALSKGVREAAVATYSMRFDGTHLIINGKVKSLVFRGNVNDSEATRAFQSLVAPDNGEALLASLQEAPGLSNLKSGSEGWMFEFEVKFEARSLGLLERPSAILDEAGEPLMEIVSPGPFHGDIDQVAYDLEEVSGPDSIFNKQSEYREYVKRQAGVRIYRDGFGVLPYGIGDDDWLGLRANTTSGGSFYGLRPNNVIGYVAISAKNNSALEEKTDREGFIRNAASLNFFRLTKQARDTRVANG